MTTLAVVGDAFASVMGEGRGSDRPTSDCSWRDLCAAYEEMKARAMELLRSGGTVEEAKAVRDDLANATAALTDYYHRYHPSPRSGPVPSTATAVTAVLREFTGIWRVTSGKPTDIGEHALTCFTYPTDLLG